MEITKKKMRKLITDTKSKISDKELFTSWAFKDHLKKISETASKRYKRPIQIKVIYDEDCGITAFTDNNVICINAGSSLITTLPLREQKYITLIGFLAHETGHILYTDFEELKNHLTSFANGAFYPEIPEVEDEVFQDNLLLVQEAIKDGKTKALKYVAKNLNNIFEDVYIEGLLNIDFPGSFKEGLSLLTEQLWELASTINEMIEKEYKDIRIIMGLILTYARFGDIKDYGYRGHLTDTFLELIPVIDCGISNDVKERQMTVNKLLVFLWEYIEKIEDDLLDEENEQLEENQTTIPSGATNSVASGGASSDDGLDDKRNSTVERLKNDDSSGDEDEKDTSVQDVTSEEGGRLPLTETEDIKEDGDGGINHNSDYKAADYEKAADDIDRLLEKMATDMATSKLEKQRAKDLTEYANKIDYGDAHKGITFSVNRISNVSEQLIKKYNQVAQSLLPISKRLQKQILQTLKDYRQGGKFTGRYMGKRIEARSIIRDDRRIFYKNTLPMEEPQMAISLLIDESGSMHGCDRITTARAASIILYDFCRALNIPISITGHTDYGSVELFSYAEFDSYDNYDKYRLMDMSARSGNRDGAALKFVAERLSKRPENFKLLIIISDGQPAAAGYYGTEAERDLKRIKTEYTRRGVTLFAAAIGDDKENIHRIYGDGFLDVTNLNMLPVLLTKLVSRFIKK